MIEIMGISKRAEDYNSVEEFYERYKTSIAESYEKYIEIVTRSEYIENYRIKKVYNPAILNLMCLSRYCWWGDTENDRKEIIDYIKMLSS